MKVSIEFLTDTLIKNGIRPSYQRVRVLEYLYRNLGHPTVDEIFRVLSPEIPSLSKVTIYNTLHTYLEAGLVQQVSIDSSEMRYDLTTAGHGHFLCEACGTIIDFPVDFDRIPLDGLAQFEISEKNVYFKGRCPNCLDQPNERNPKE